MNYSDYAKGDTIIAKYMQMMEAQETPLAYDFWCALWMIGVAVGRSVVVARPRAPVHLNTYMVLVGESGILRKSTAVNAATRVTRRFLELGNQATTIIDGRITTSQLIREMMALNNGGQDAQIALSISELAATLGRGGGAHDMPVLLTDLYDCPGLRRGGSRAEGVYTVRNAFVSLIGASTPAWLLRAVNPTVVEGGFTSRCLFILADKRKRKVAWPMESEDDRQQQDDIANLLYRRSCDLALARRIAVTDAAQRKFAAWYSSRKLGTDVFRSSFDSRGDAHVLRVAGLLSVSDGSCSIHARHIDNAINLIDRVRNDGARIFAGSEEDKADPVIKAFDRLRTLLVNAGRDGLTQGRIVLNMAHHADGDGCLRMLEALHELDMVQKFVLPSTGRGGRPRTVWRATKAIFSTHGGRLAQLLAAPTTVLPEGPQSETAS